MALRIIISDAGTSSEYHLVGTTLTMVESGGCRDALNKNACSVSETDDEDEIVEAVLESWMDGYEFGEGCTYEEAAAALNIQVLRPN